MLRIDDTDQSKEPATNQATSSAPPKKKNRVKRKILRTVSGRIIQALKPKKNVYYLEENEIQAHQTIKHTGELHIKGNVGEGAKITLNHGKLTIDGNIADNAIIHVIRGGKEWKTQQIEINDKSLSFKICKSDIFIQGNVGNNVKIHARNSFTSITVLGKVGDACNFKTTIGHISASSIGKNCTMETTTGEITILMTGEGSALIVAKNGNVNALHIKEGVKITDASGHIYIQNMSQANHATLFRGPQTQVHYDSLQINSMIDDKPKGQRQGME